MVANGLFSYFRKEKLLVIFSIFSFLFFISMQRAEAQDADAGKTLFQTNCAACHNPVKDMTGPALKGVADEVPGGMDWIYEWVRNSSKVIASGDEYANQLFEEWGQLQMTHFPDMTDEDIDNIFAYVDNFEAPGGSASGAAAAGAEGGDSGSGGGNNTLLFGVLSLVLAVLALILLRVNKNLREMANATEGEPNHRNIPFFLRKRNLFVLVVVFFCLAGYLLVDGAATIGYSKNYMPEQPIFYSHEVHAGINQINCLYCHSGAEKSRHAMIPSPNVCMNCHEVIDEYTGKELFNEEGDRVDGTEEIQKLYEYAGWDAESKQYVAEAKPIEWIKVHNLPDYVYFNHSQHVKVGDVQCQTCHGEVQNMNEVHQHATLGMGWCVNCHRETKVQFADNDYYSIYNKYEEQLRMHEIEGVTVEMQGGLDCSSCHY